MRSHQHIHMVYEIALTYNKSKGPIIIIYDFNCTTPSVKWRLIRTKISVLLKLLNKYYNKRMIYWHHRQEHKILSKVLLNCLSLGRRMAVHRAHYSLTNKAVPRQYQDKWTHFIYSTSDNNQTTELCCSYLLLCMS